MRLREELILVVGGLEYLVRTMEEDDVEQDYVDALLRERKYLANVPANIDIVWQREYVRRVLASERDTVLGMECAGRLIGSAGLQNLEPEGPAGLGILLFDPKARGQGLGKSLVWAASTLAMSLSPGITVAAGMLKSNRPSLGSFLRCGYSVFEETATAFRVHVSQQYLVRPDVVTAATLRAAV